MTKSIPGTIVVEGREFLYIESHPGETFHQIMDCALSDCEYVPLPCSGGIIEHGTFLKLENGVTLMAVSCKGDVEGWRNKLQEFCERDRRLWGVAADSRLRLSDEREIDLNDSNFVFE